MSDAPKKDPRAMLRRAAVEIPLAAISYGVGYGIARTALEAMARDSNSALNRALERTAPSVRAALPFAAGALATYVAHRAHQQVKKSILEGP